MEIKAFFFEEFHFPFDKSRMINPIFTVEVDKAGARFTPSELNFNGFVNSVRLEQYKLFWIITYEGCISFDKKDIDKACFLAKH